MVIAWSDWEPEGMAGAGEVGWAAVPGAGVPLRRARALVLALAFGMTACGAGERGGAGAVVRDSAGITIVENASPVWGVGEGWRVALEPAVEIGVVEGEDAYQLDRVADAARLADGRIVIADGGTNELRYFDPDGRHLRTVGGEGAGPGEFRFIGPIVRLPGDSLLVSNRFPPRVALFDPEGRFVRSVDIGHVAEGRLADGMVLVEVTERLEGLPSGPMRLPVRVVGRDLAGDRADTLVMLPGTQRDFRATQSAGRVVEVEVWPVPFARGSYWSAAGDRIYAGASDAYEIGVYVPGAGLTRLVRRSGANRPVTAEAIDRFRRQTLDRASDENARRRMEQRLAQVTYPETLPAYSDLAADAEGNLWVRDYSIDEAENRWDVFDPDGRWLGTVELPPGLKPFEIGGDYVLGLWKDELGVERVRLHAIEK